MKANIILSAALNDRSNLNKMTKNSYKEACYYLGDEQVARSAAMSARLVQDIEKYVKQLESKLVVKNKQIKQLKSELEEEKNKTTIFVKELKEEQRRGYA